MVRQPPILVGVQLVDQPPDLVHPETAPAAEEGQGRGYLPALVQLDRAANLFHLP